MLRRNGFTLIEVMVALTLSAIVVLLAHRLMTGVLDGVQRAREERDRLDRDMNARRWLTETFGSLDVGAKDQGFTGRAHSAEFTTWRQTADRNFIRTGATITFSSDTLWLDQIPLLTAVKGLDLDYLLEPGANAAWVREWVSPVAAPVAVRLRIDHGTSIDTLLFLVGPRG